MNIGVVPDLAGWIPNQAYYPRNLIAIVLRNGITGSTGGEFVVRETVRALMELHPFGIDGLNTGFSLHDNSPKQVTFRWNERYGRPIDKFFLWWYNKYRRQWMVQNQVNDEGTLDVMFIEPDPTHTKVVHAYYMYWMRPLEYSGIESSRDLTVARGPASKPAKPNLWQRIKAHLKGDPIREAMIRAQQAVAAAKLTTVKVTFAGELSMGPDVDALAQDLLNGLNVMSSDPSERVNNPAMSEAALAQRGIDFLRDRGPNVYQI